MKSLLAIQGRPRDETRLTGPTSQSLDALAGEAPPRVSLETAVRRFTETLNRDYANRIKRRPEAFRSRVIALVRLNLPPHPKPSGRPQQPRITRAVEMYATQLLEKQRGSRKRINWNAIAKNCIPGYVKIRSEYKRRVEIDRLRDGVYGRRRLGKRKKRRR